MLKKIIISIIILLVIIFAFLEGLGLGAWNAVTNQSVYDAVIEWRYDVENIEQEL